MSHSFRFVFQAQNFLPNFHRFGLARTNDPSRVPFSLSSFRFSFLTINKFHSIKKRKRSRNVEVNVSLSPPPFPSLPTVLFQLPFVRERRTRSRGAARETGGGERASEIDRTRVRNSLGTIVCAVGSSVEFHRRYAPRRLMLRLRKRETGYLNSGSPRLACRVSWRTTVEPPMEPPLVHDRVNGVNSENPWLVHHRPASPPLQRDD